MICEQNKVNITHRTHVSLDYETIHESPEQTEAVLQDSNSNINLYKHTVTALLTVIGLECSSISLVLVAFSLQFIN